MACSKAEDLINQLIEATLKLLDFGLNIMDALRVQKLLTIRNQKIGLISDDACLPECSLRFSLNFDLMMFNKLLRNACLRARATLNELRVCRLRYPNAPLVLEPKTKLKFQKLQKKIRDFDDAVRSDKMIARRDLRDFREISIIFSQLEHDLKLLICSLECASTMKDTVLFAAPITDVMTVLSIVLSRLERLAQKAEIDEKIAAAEQQKALQEQKIPASAQSNSAERSTRPPDHLLLHGQNSNRTTAKERRQEMTAMIAAAAAASRQSQRSKSIDHRERVDDETKRKTPINRKHHRSIKSRISPLSSDDDEKNQLSSSDLYQRLDREEMKEFRQQWIDKWTEEAREMSSDRMRRRPTDPMRVIDAPPSPSSMLKKKKKKKTKKHHRQLSPQNNSAMLVLQSDDSSSNEDDFQCRIS